jgi:integrase
VPIHLTMALARSLPGPEGGKDDKLHFDDDVRGLTLRVRKSGGRSWLLQYRVSGKPQRITLGAIDVIDIAKARILARDLIAGVRFGRDPAREKRDARARAEETFQALVQKFLERVEKQRRPPSFAHTKRHLEKHFSAFHPLPVTEISRRMVERRISELEHVNGAYAARSARSSLNGFFAWAVRADYLEANPVINTNTPIIGQARERVLSDEELKRIWLALGDNLHGKIVKLLILTGARRTEIGGLAWAEIDFERALISLAARRTKNGRPHLIPLSPAALAILRSCTRPGPLLFTQKATTFREWHAYKIKLDQRLVDGGGEPMSHWTYHDFRRSISTSLHERFNFPPHIVEAILGHVSGCKTGVAATYNKSVYLDERRRALTRWADHIMSLVSGESVDAKGDQPALEMNRPSGV